MLLVLLLLSVVVIGGVGAVVSWLLLLFSFFLRDVMFPAKFVLRERWSLPSFEGCVLFYRYQTCLHIKGGPSRSHLFSPLVCLEGAGSVVILAFQALLLVEIDHCHAMFLMLARTAPDCCSKRAILCYRRGFAPPPLPNGRVLAMQVVPLVCCPALLHYVRALLWCAVAETCDPRRLHGRGRTASSGDPASRPSPGVWYCTVHSVVWSKLTRPDSPCWCIRSFSLMRFLLARKEMSGSFGVTTSTLPG